ncbi:uncharacterized protein DNG_00381 [Cephalotrichum gorgonifer]|uniref:Uncharacterized protein n=1 Tax=Cephalotrichum gorgonifer TaxID=2041049 RepID=A0AAE8MPB5_9PEZI|nr:uncharacterized protein DNG_00381 [Cephalotrichum gorgonifer]
MPPKSLVALCLGTILKNINLVSGIGDDLPPDNPYVQKILARIGSSAQLREMEINSPQLQGHTDKYWKELIQRDFPNSRKKNYVPSDPSGWWKVYKRHKKEHDESLQAATAALKNAFDGIAEKEGRNVSVVLDRSRLPRPTRTGRSIGGPRRPPKRPDTSSLAFTAGSRTKLISGKSVLKRARREARDIAVQRGSLANLSRPLDSRSNQLRAAPASFIESNRVASQPALRAALPQAPKKPAVSETYTSYTSKGRKDEPEAIIVGASDEEDSDNLFDDSDEERPAAKKSRYDSGRSGFRRANDSSGGNGWDGVKTKPTVSKDLGVDSSTTTPIKRKHTALLPGKPGAGRFLGKSSVSSSKVTASPNPSETSRSLSRPSPNSSGGTRVTTKSSPPARRASPPPQTKPTASSPPPAAMPPRKRKVDIFMKPRRRT